MGVCATHLILLLSQKHPPGIQKVTTLVPFIFESNPWDVHKTYVGIHPGYVSTLLCVLRIQSVSEKEEVGASSHALWEELELIIDAVWWGIGCSEWPWYNGQSMGCSAENYPLQFIAEHNGVRRCIGPQMLLYTLVYSIVVSHIVAQHRLSKLQRKIIFLHWRIWVRLLL